MKPKRFTSSVPFVLNGRGYVQVGDAGDGFYCLVPHDGTLEGFKKLQFVLDSLNLKHDANELITLIKTNF